MAMLIEYQPTLFDNLATNELRYLLEKQRKSFFVRYNLLEKRCRELEERYTILEQSLCKESMYGAYVRSLCTESKEK